MLRLREIIGAGVEVGTMSYSATIWENGDSLIWTKSSDPKKEIKQAKYDLASRSDQCIPWYQQVLPMYQEAPYHAWCRLLHRMCVDWP